MKSFSNGLTYLFVFLATIGTLASVLTGHSGFLFPLFTALGNLLLGGTVILNNPKSNINRAFFVVTLSVVAWTTSIFLYWQAPDAVFAYWCSKMAYASTSLVPAFLVYFTRLYPFEEKPLSPGIKFVIFFPIFILLPLDFANLVVVGVAKTSWGYNLLPGPGYWFFSVYMVTYMIWAMANVFWRYARSVGRARNQVRYLLLGFFFGSIIPFVTNLILPQFGNTSFTSIGPSCTIIFVAFLAYAITKHRLMDISVIISRAAAEFLATLFLGVGYLLFYWFYRAYVSTRLDALFAMFSVMYGIFVEQAYPPFRTFFQTTSDKLFLHGKYDYYKALSDASSKVGGKLALPDILKVLYYTFSDVVEVANPRIFLPEHFTEADKTSTDYVIYDKAEFSPQTEGQRIKIADPLINELIAEREPLHEVKPLNAALVVPCLLEDRLIAFFALGPKLSEDAYTDEDVRILKTLANQVAITLDHTRSYEKIKADLEVAEMQLERSQRLASLGTLTAGVTHEIRNPLTVIRAETERLANQERDLDYLKQFRELVLKHIDRISSIVSRMLQLAKEKEKQDIDVNLNEVIEATTQFFTISNIVVKKDLQPVPSIKGDPEALQEVFVNLIQNALDAMSGKGELTLRTYKEDGHVVAEVSDTGKGVPEEIREKIFDPFYSTRHEGVGLGLSIVYRIVREHGGSIKVESQVGKGSTFKLSF
jgi:signal transduction histidine kinase